MANRAYKGAKVKGTGDREQLRLVGYARVSTDNQAQEGTIEIQKQALTEYAEAQGYELVEIFSDEGVSGGLEGRPGLAELFDYLERCSDVDGVLIFKLDRLARDLMIQENLIRDIEKRGKRLLSTKEPDLDSKDPTRVFIRQVLGATSQYEKAMITMRLSGGRIHKARQGGYAGGSAALGYTTKNHDLKIDQEQAETVKLIFHLRHYGRSKGHKRLSMAAIAQELNDRGIPTARGGQWHASTIKYILDNPLYKGHLEYRGETAQRADLALVGGKLQ